MDNKIREIINEALKRLTDVRKDLIAASQLAMSSDELDMDLVNRLFDSSKKAELLRRDCESLSKDEHSAPIEYATKPRYLELMARKKNYPKYEYRDDTIVRIGLSSDGTEYEQALRRSDFEEILSVFNRFATREEFSVEDVQKELDVPSYQTYLVVSLLREQAGFLESKRRGKYKFKSPKPIAADDVIAKI